MGLATDGLEQIPQVGDIEMGVESFVPEPEQIPQVCGTDTQQCKQMEWNIYHR